MHANRQLVNQEAKPAGCHRPRLLAALAAAVLLLPCLTGCHRTTFRFGMGGNGIGQATMQRYYLFFGLIPLNEVDIQRYVGGLTGYDVEVGFSDRDDFTTTVADVFISLLFLPLSVTRQAVTVKW